MKKILRQIYNVILKRIPFFNIIYYSRTTQTPITWKILFFQKLLGINSKAYWPVHFTSTIKYPENIYSGIDVSPGYMPGCYIQGMGEIYLGDYTQIGPNVGIITANHDFNDNRKDILKKVYIGKYCWLGMGAMIMPNVTLGDFTIVAAGAIVTKSHEDGYCILAGNPAKVIKNLDKEECYRYENEVKYNGYIKSSEFESYRIKNLKI